MEAVIVAVVTACGGLLAVLLQKGRKENQEDHGKVMEKLVDLHKDVHHVEVKIDHVDVKLNDHILMDHVSDKLNKKVKKK